MAQVVGRTDGFEEAELFEPLEALTGGFDALVIPGGVMNPDRLRRVADAASFVRDFSTRASRWRQSATAFIDKVLEEIGEGVHAGQHA